MSHVLYRMFDAGGDLLYVGRSMRVETRLRTHGRQKDWWAYVRTITLEPHPSHEALVAAEDKAIVEEKPRHNIKRNLTDDELRERIRRGRNLARPRTYRDLARSLHISREEVLRLADVPDDARARRWRGSPGVPVEPARSDA